MTDLLLSILATALVHSLKKIFFLNIICCANLFVTSHTYMDIIILLVVGTVVVIIRIFITEITIVIFTVMGYILL